MKRFGKAKISHKKPYHLSIKNAMTISLGLCTASEILKRNTILSTLLDDKQCNVMILSVRDLWHMLFD